jgi:hypothetical protein
MTLAPKTGKVSWVSMGLQWVPFLAEVCTFPSKSQVSLSGSEVVVLEFKFRGVSSTVSGHAGSRIDSAGDRHATASRYPVPRNLNRFGF